MLDLANHIVATKSAHFEPDKFEDRYETALRAIIKRKAAGEKITPAKALPEPKVINLMDALKRSLAAEQGQAGKATSKAASGSRAASKKSSKAAPDKKARKRA